MAFFENGNSKNFESLKYKPFRSDKILLDDACDPDLNFFTEYNLNSSSATYFLPESLTLKKKIITFL